MGFKYTPLDGQHFLQTLHSYAVSHKMFHLLSGRSCQKLNYLEVGLFDGASFIESSKLFTHAENQLVGIELAPSESLSYNLRELNDSRARYLMGQPSDVVLRELLLQKEEFDIIYIDGSHQFLHVLADASLSWLLLKPNGLLIFDDYTETGFMVDHSKTAIDIFLANICGRYEVLHAGRQIWIIKNTI